MTSKELRGLMALAALLVAVVALCVVNECSRRGQPLPHPSGIALPESAATSTHAGADQSAAADGTDSIVKPDSHGFKPGKQPPSSGRSRVSKRKQPPAKGKQPGGKREKPQPPDRESPLEKQLTEDALRP